MIKMISKIENDEDQKWMETLYREISLILFKYAFKLSGHEADSYDLVQSTFLILLGKIKLLRTFQKSQIISYSIVVLKHIFYKSRSIHKNYVDFNDISDIIEEYNTEDIVLKQFDRELLKKCLDQLPERYKDFLTLKFFVGLSNKEIADTLNLRGPNVRMLQSRALQRLRSLVSMEENGDVR